MDMFSNGVMTNGRGFRGHCPVCQDHQDLVAGSDGQWFVRVNVFGWTRKEAVEWIQQHWIKNPKLHQMNPDREMALGPPKYRHRRYHSDHCHGASNHSGICLDTVAWSA